MTAVLELDEVTRIHGTGPIEVTALRAVSFTAYTTCPSPSAPWPSTKPSRSRRESVV